MAPHLWANFEIQKYYQNEPKCNGIYSNNNLSEVTYWAFVKNLDDLKSIRTHWIALMQPTLIAFELNIFQKKCKTSKETKTS